MPSLLPCRTVPAALASRPASDLKWAPGMGTQLLGADHRVQAAGDCGSTVEGWALQTSSWLLPTEGELGQALPPSWAKSRQKVNLWQSPALGFSLPRLGQQ